MGIIDLNKRHTGCWREMHQNLQSPDSKVFVLDANNINLTSMDLEVGQAYILPGSNRQYAIPEDGLVVKPRHSVVIFTKQRIKLPYNVFGVVTGKGTYIFKGCFLATGKIDPAFDGYLKIGFYNGGDTSIKLPKGTPFATAYFINTDSTLEAPLENYQSDMLPDLKKLTFHTKVWSYLKDHLVSFIAWGVVAIPAAVYYVLEIINCFK